MPKAGGFEYTLQASQGSERELPLLVLPGFPGGRAGSAWLTERLSQTRRVLSVDPLGSAGSEVPAAQSAEYSFPNAARRLLSLLDELELKRVEVLGMSLGGVWAQYAMAEAPSRFARGWLVGTCARLRARERAWAEHVLAQLDSTLSMQAIARAAALQQFTPQFLRRPAALMLLDRFVNHVQLRREGFVGQFRAMLEHDSRALLPRCTFAVDVIVGACDGVFPPDLSEEVAQQLPNARLHVMDGVGHCPWIEAPEAFLALLRQ